MSWTKKASEELYEVERIRCHSGCRRVNFCSIEHHSDCLYKKSLHEWVSRWLLPENVTLFKKEIDEE